MTEVMACDGETLLGNHPWQIPRYAGIKTEGLLDLLEIS